VPELGLSDLPASVAAIMCATCGGPLSRQGKVYCSWQCSNGRPGACGVELRRREGTLSRPYVLGSTGPASRVYIRECAWCGKLFVGRAVNSRGCSRACTRKFNWAVTAAERRVAEHTCPCGATIQPSRQKCDACVHEARAQRRRKERARARVSVAAEPYTLAEIAARDRYRCGICIAEGRSRQARVVMTQAVPHPKAPTIDHIVPWSISKDDTRANVQLAHFICNSRKHVHGSQQLALFG
jgi:5-methylcytosine-specific restriction endonuclease McrA